MYHDGQRLPASYCNFYIANGVVIVPQFDDPADAVALEMLAAAVSRPRSHWACAPSIWSGAWAHSTASRSKSLFPDYPIYLFNGKESKSCE